MTTLPAQRGTRRRLLADMLTDNDAEVVDVRAGSRPQTHRLTVRQRTTGTPVFTAVIADRDESVAAVEHEGHLMVELRRGSSGSAVMVAPRHVGVAEHCGRPVVLLSPVPGRLLGQHDRQPTRSDVSAAFAWLRSLWDETALDVGCSDLGVTALEQLRARHSDDPGLVGALRRVSEARERLGLVSLPQTMSHGSLTMEKVAVERGRVVGVEDWACCTVAGDPLRDLGRLAVSSAGSRVDRLLRDRRAVVSALRAGVKQGLRCLGLDPRLCPDVLILTLAEQAGGTDQGRRRAGLDALQSYLATTKG